MKFVAILPHAIHCIQSYLSLYLINPVIFLELFITEHVAFIIEKKNIIIGWRF